MRSKKGSDPKYSFVLLEQCSMNHDYAYLDHSKLFHVAAKATGVLKTIQESLSPIL